MRVLLTGAAGFIGGHVRSALSARGHEVVCIDLMLASAHGESPEVPEGVLRVDVRDSGTMERLLAGIDVVCHQAAVVGAGVDANDSPAFASHNDFGTAVLLAAMQRARCRRLVLASSMVVYGDGRYRCERHGLVNPPPRQDKDLRQGLFDNRCPVGGELLTWELVDEDCAAPPQKSVRGQQDGPGALRPGLVAQLGWFGHRSALPQRLWRSNAPRHPLLRGGGHVPVVP